MNGDYELEDTVYVPFTTRAFATGIPTALVSGEVQVYEDASVTQITAAETLTVSIDSVVGFNMCSVAATAANGFETGKSYTCILSAGTVGGVSVVGEVVGQFTIEASAAVAKVATAQTDLDTITGAAGVIIDDSAANDTTISAAVWDEDATGHQTTGTFGKAIGDPAANTETIYDAVITDAVGINVAADVISAAGTIGDVEVDTQDLQTQIGTAGAGLTDITLNAASIDLIWDEVLTGATHNIANSAGRRLRNLQDFGVYEGGYIWVDTVNGTAGTTDFESGTVNNPVDTIADAYTLQASIGLLGFHVLPASSITLAASSAGFGFTGANYSLDFGSQDITGSTFLRSTNLSGTGTGTNGTPFVIQECQLGTASLAAFGFLETVAVNGTVTLTSTSGVTADSISFFSCFSGVPGTGAPTITAAGVTKTTNIQTRNWFGGITGIMTSDCVWSHEVVAGGAQSFTNNGGSLEIRGSMKSVVLTTTGSGTTNIVVGNGCEISVAGTGGTVNVYGMHGGITDTSSGTTITDFGGDIPAGIATAQADLDIITGASGVNLLTATQASIDAIEADTNELQADDVPGLIAALDAVVDTVKAETALILADTADIQPNYATEAKQDTAQADLDTISNGIINGTAATGTLSTTVCTSSLTGYTDDQLIGRIITFLAGPADGESSDITDYASTDGTITFTALTLAPENGNAFKIT